MVYKINNKRKFNSSKFSTRYSNTIVFKTFFLEDTILQDRYLALELSALFVGKDNPLGGTRHTQRKISLNPDEMYSVPFIDKIFLVIYVIG